LKRSRLSGRPAASFRSRSADALLGRVVNAIGEPIDGKGPIAAEGEHRLEVQAPGIVKRQPVSEPLQTGIKAIDAMTPIGRGQRELLIGDRKTGKTTVAVDTIINQRGNGVKCIYVAIGQKGSSIAQTVATLADYGAMDYTVVVAAAAFGRSAFQVPGSLCGLRHGTTLDGQRRARLDRLRRPVQAGRRLPPDLSSAQASSRSRGLSRRRVLPAQRLLERAAKMSDEFGGGSFTALPSSRPRQATSRRTSPPT